MTAVQVVVDMETSSVSPARLDRGTEGHTLLVACCASATRRACLCRSRASASELGRIAPPTPDVAPVCGTLDVTGCELEGSSSCQAGAYAASNRGRTLWKVGGLETGGRLSVFARLSSSRVSRLACWGGYGA